MTDQPDTNRAWAWSRPNHQPRGFPVTAIVRGPLVVEPVGSSAILKHIRLERPLVVLDLETTGTRVQSDRIVEISTLKLLPDGTNRIRTRRLNPGVPIPPEATAVHGI